MILYTFHEFWPRTKWRYHESGSLGGEFDYGGNAGGRIGIVGVRGQISWKMYKPTFWRNSVGFTLFLLVFFVQKYQSRSTGQILEKITNWTWCSTFGGLVGVETLKYWEYQENMVFHLWRSREKTKTHQNTNRKFKLLLYQVCSLLNMSRHFIA